MFFGFVLLCIRGEFSSASSPAVGLYLEGRFKGGFFCVTSLGGLYLEGAYFRNFTVSIHQTLIKRKTQRALGVS